MIEQKVEMIHLIQKHVREELECDAMYLVSTSVAGSAGCGEVLEGLVHIFRVERPDSEGVCFAWISGTLGQPGLSICTRLRDEYVRTPADAVVLHPVANVRRRKES